MYGIIAGLEDAVDLDTAGRGVWADALLAAEEPDTGGRVCVGFVPGAATLTGLAAAVTGGTICFAADAGTLFPRAGTVAAVFGDAPVVVRGFGACPDCICARSILALTVAVGFAGDDAARRRFAAKISALSNPSVLSLSKLPG